MFQFFADKSQIFEEEKRICLEGADVNHIRNVLRMKAGERFYVTDKEAQAKYLCTLCSAEEDRAVCEILKRLTERCELPCGITLYQGLPKADKMELIVQKAVELGVVRIVPVACARSIVKLDAKKAQAKAARWQSIAEAAAKQSKRDRIPEVGGLMSFSEALKEAQEADVRLMPYEKAESMETTRQIFSAIQPGQSIAVFIGPEGGFEEKEVQAALQAHTRAITLGRRILRTETAGLCVLSMLNYVLEP